MATGMITRHYEHPSGATATLEMPAGWSRSCWYEFAVNGGKPERWNFANPEESRKAAIARERQALANGWRPRMAAMTGTPSLVASMHLPSGERIASVLTISIRTIEHSRDYEPRYKKTRIVLAQEQMVDLQVNDGGHSRVQPGERFILRQETGRSQTIMACIVRDLDRESYGNHRCRVQASVVALEDGESEATDPDRQAIIQAGVETDTDLITLWGWLGTKIQDASERQQVNAAIIRGRAERQARLRREQEEAEGREILRRQRDAEEFRRAIAAAAERSRAPLFRTESERLAARRQEQTEETLRRLSGGTDLSKPKKRKIDLGE